VSDGKGCRCNAHCEHECCCDADWTPKEVYDLRADLAQRTAEVAKAWLTNATLRADLARAEAERDEARREVCQATAFGRHDSAEDAAAYRGWDCFEKEGKP
jgi:hypothetical protein